MSLVAQIFRSFVALACWLILSFPAQALDQITIGYFLEWPTPNLVAKQQAVFSQEMAVKVNWRAFETSEDMVKAIDQGKIEIAFAMELIPFMRGLNQSVDMTATAIAVSYPDHQLCMVRKKDNLNVDNMRFLKGLTVATLPASETHFKLQKILQHYGVDINDVILFPAGDGATVAKALYKNISNISCAYGGPVQTMRKVAKPLLSGEQQEAIGLKTFDLVVMSDQFIDDHRDLAKKFLQINERYNLQYKADAKTMEKTIATESGMSLESARIFLQMFNFPTMDQQVSMQWFGRGGIARDYSADLGRFLVEHGKLQKFPDNLNTRMNFDL